MAHSVKWKIRIFCYRQVSEGNHISVHAIKSTTTRGRDR